MSSEAYLRLTCDADCLANGRNSLSSTAAYRDVYFNSSSSVEYDGDGADDSVLLFPMVVQANETITGLTYVGEQALVTQDVCKIYSTLSDGLQLCASQNLPAPDAANTKTSSGDLISPLSFNISQDAPVVVGVDFRKHTVHLGGGIATALPLMR